MKKRNYLIIIISLIKLANTGYSQCTTVCGTVTTTGGSFTLSPAGTQSVYVVNTPSVYVINSSSGGGTPVDSLVQGNNQSNNSKETTLNLVNGSISSSLDSLSNIDNNTKKITITPTFSVINSTGSATIAAGFKFASIANTGTAVATVNGFTLNVGEILSFPPIWNSVYNQIVYNALTSTLHIIQSR